MQATSKDNNKNNKLPLLPIYFQPKRMYNKFIFQIFSFIINNFYVQKTNLLEHFC
jgi:hypothetical protein